MEFTKDLTDWINTKKPYNREGFWGWASVGHSPTGNTNCELPHEIMVSLLWQDWKENSEAATIAIFKEAVRTVTLQGWEPDK